MITLFNKNNFTIFFLIFIEFTPLYYLQSEDKINKAVKIVDSFPNKCGEWRIVHSFPDLKVQLVNSFADLKVKYVESFPGIP
jgi:hypothetical protein